MMTFQRQGELELQSTKEIAQHIEAEKNSKFLCLILYFPGILDNNVS
jgi:hypothetical protein